MSRIVVVGVGRPAFAPGRFHGGPGMRSAHFAEALARAGHEVELVAVGERGIHRGNVNAGGAAVPWRGLVESPSVLGDLASIFDETAADAVVGATAYASAIAARAVGKRPLWADVFGDLMSEAQAKAAVAGSDWALAHFWTMLRTVLLRGDRFSAVSSAQADALVGQLGLAGRLSGATAGVRLVHRVPCAASTKPAQGEAPVAAPGDEQRNAAILDAARLPAGAFVVLLSGGFNTWFDVDATVAGVARAMESIEDLHLVVTGGAIRGHDESSYPRFLAALEQAGIGDRCHRLGWIEDRELGAVYARADVGLIVEKDLYERRFGSENRVVEWLRHGLPSVTTARSELGRALVEAGVAFAIGDGGAGPANADAVAGALLAAHRRREDLPDLGLHCRRYAKENHDPDRTAAPLLRWCEAPVRAADADSSARLDLGLTSHPDTMVEMLEGYLEELSLQQVLFRGVRWLGRRVGAGTRSEGGDA